MVHRFHRVNVNRSWWFWLSETVEVVGRTYT